jgi:hypothetical protein
VVLNAAAVGIGSLINVPEAPEAMKGLIKTSSSKNEAMLLIVW